MNVLARHEDVQGRGLARCVLEILKWTLQLSRVAMYRMLRALYFVQVIYRFLVL